MCMELLVSALSPHVLSSQKLLSSSGRAGRLRLMGKYIDHRLVARTEPDNTFWTDSTVGHKSYDPCFHKRYTETGVMTFVAHCTKFNP